MKPLLLLSRGHDDAEFLYACHLSIEQALYLRFAPGDDELMVSGMELDRARREGRARRIRDREEAGWSERQDTMATWVDLARRVLAERALSEVRVSPLLPAAAYVGLRAAGVEPEIDHRLFLDERRRKSAEEADCIRAAQGAAEAACVEVIAQLAAAEAQRDGLLWLDGSPLTSERLMARAQAALNEIGYTASEMIVAGSPECALPHFRGAGPIRANAPVIIDIFPMGMSTHYHGDLTRTVVAGQPSDLVQRMHDTCVEALDAAVELLREGANGRDVHHAVCRRLLDRGFGSATKGFEGDPSAPRMTHSTGHGVGLDVHEAPQLRDLDYPLLAGDVVTVEPGLYQTGLGGVRVEDTGMVAADGFQNFTTLPRSLDPADYL
ncbi:MAG TPA: Xaa-Pro peptidase family protein [Terriglobales bacterium]|nr:Xaa-Pro peptidase family protein [Terriglobales bacterium]